MPLLPVNPSPCVPGMPPFGNAFGSAWASSGGVGGNAFRGANGQDGTAGQGGLDGTNGMTPQVSQAFNQMREVIQQLTQAVRQLAQPTSRNFTDIQRILNTLEQSQSGGLAVLRGPLVAGGAQVAERMSWNGFTFVPNGETIEVVDVFLNAGESVDSGTRIDVGYRDGVLAVVAMYCAAADPAL